MKNIQEAQISGKNVLLRIDTDVNIIQKTEDGRRKTEIIDDSRLVASVPTLKYLLDGGAKVTIIGHIGRPKGKMVEDLKMRPVEDKLIELLGTHQNWQILENLRFSAGEEKNEPEFSKQLVAGQDIFVQDAFASCHRAHASTVGITKILPSYAGLSVQKEIEGLTEILTSPKQGFTIIIGGKKAKDKLPVILNLISCAENFLIGGVVANTFLASEGYNLGKSLVETEVLVAVKKIKSQFIGDQFHQLFLPEDLVFSKSLEKDEEVKTLTVKNLTDIDDYYAVDLGPKTIERYCQLIAEAKTIFWNGNFGVTEIDNFDIGTMKIAEAIANSRAKKYAGGGDTGAFIRNSGIAENFDFLSIGGGAALEFLAGKILPGLEAIR